jgi:alkanesulfonate monooxygenase SsuD/methylene tetrahydromethanopterin reductase-like flavin-dependent oxidoreductase (luciferase family)
MKFALFVPNLGPYADARLHGDLAVECEKHGWDGYMTWDIMHPVEPLKGLPVIDPWTCMSVVADRTERVRISALVTPVPRRRPITLARQATSVDRLSNGRLVLSVGLGLSEEFAVLGQETDAKTRAAMLDEGLEVIARLWSGETVNFDGTFYKLDGAQFQPTPVQRPRIPIWVAAEMGTRPLVRAGRWDGMAPISLQYFEDGYLSTERMAEIISYAKRERDPAAPFDATFIPGSVTNAPGATPENIEAYERAGATWWLASAPHNDVAAAFELIRSGPPAR